MSDQQVSPGKGTAVQRSSQKTAVQKEINTLTLALEGMEWKTGTDVVRGADLSPQTRYIFAEFCRITKANPVLHVDMLGGKPYLNAQYWEDRIISDPFYVSHTQRDITLATENELRRRAQESREASLGMKKDHPEEASRLIAKALQLEEEADDIASHRSHYGVPEWATAAVETIIRRYMNVAPLDRIKAGEISFDEAEKFVIEVREANWAGGRPATTKKRRDGQKYTYDSDPIGNEEPSKTARTRSLRRAAKRGFSAWMESYEKQVQKAEEIIEAEWEVIQEEAPRVPATVSTSAGEPEAGTGRNLRTLPEEEDGVVIREAEVVEDRAPEPEPQGEPDGFDREDARKKLFATLRDAGVKEADRKEWAKNQGLPASTSQWTKEHYEKAIAALIDPVREGVLEMAEELGQNLPDLCLSVLGKDTAEYLRDWKVLHTVLLARMPGEPEVDAQVIGEEV